MPICTVNAAYLTKGSSLRQGYGVKFELELETPAYSQFNPNDKQYKIDFHGNYFAGLPPGGSVLADWVLPLKVHRPTFRPQNNNIITMEFTLGARELTHETAKSTLQKMVEQGDPLVMIEIFEVGGINQPSVTLCECNILISKVLQSFSNNNNNNNRINAIERRNEVVPRRSKRLSKLFKSLRWSFFPLLFAILCWSMLIYQSPYAEMHPLLSYTPIIIPALMKTNFTVNFQTEAPFAPSTMSAAWKLGYLHSNLLRILHHSHFDFQSLNLTSTPFLNSSSSDGNDGENDNMKDGWWRINDIQNGHPLLGGGGGGRYVDVDERIHDHFNKLYLHNQTLREEINKTLNQYINQVMTISDRSLPPSLTSIFNTPFILTDIEEQQGLVTKFIGFFSVVNILWLLAIVGISISIGPSIYIFLKPIRRYFIRYAKMIWYRVVKPTLMKMNDWGIFEAIAWSGCFILMIDSLRIKSNVIAEFITITVYALVAPSFAYTFLLWGAEIVKSLSAKNLSNLVNAMIVIWVLPLCLYYESILMAFACVCCLYSILGFSVISYRLCIMIGFDSKEAVIRTSITSILLLVIYSGLRMYIPNPQILKPFQIPIAVMGSITMYLGLLIFSTYNYSYRVNYTIRQIPIIVMLLFGLIVGNMVIPGSGFSNTAIVFLVLYCVEKGIDVHTHNRWKGWTLVLFISVCFYYFALWLHAHPDIVSSLLSAF